MKSEDTKRIIREIAKEEGLSEWAVTLIVKSQFEGVHEVITSATPDQIDTFKSVRLNAFCYFKVMSGVFKRYIKKQTYYDNKRLRYDNKKQSK